jgi:hypothetical protein
MFNRGVEIGTEEIETEDSVRVLSFNKIHLEGVGDMPDDSEE